MSLELLGEGFDLHCGGLDLKFPHHENERAQAVALGKRFANHWMHHAFVVDASGEKMSKSLGNFDNLLDLVDVADPRAFRMALLQAHYRSPVQVNKDTIEAASRAVGRLDALARRAAGLAGTEPDAAVVAAFVAAMDDDLDTPKAMAIVFDAVNRANAALDASDPSGGPLAEAALELAGAVGLEVTRGVEAPAEVAAKVAELDEARATRDFARADALRAELQADGWTVETTRDGTTVHRS
jgi:cysteinyl-tRNA synthetase